MSIGLAGRPEGDGGERSLSEGGLDLAAIRARHGPVIALLALGFLLHGAPYLVTPFGTDVDWVFRLQLLDPNDQRARGVPEVFKRFIAYPTVSGWQSFLDWHAFTGRLNVLDILSWRAIAAAAPDSPYGWKIFALSFALGATALFYSLLRRL